MKTFLELAKRKYSCRKYLSDRVKKEDLDYVFGSRAHSMVSEEFSNLEIFSYSGGICL